jgi:Tfp pilus assembly protein PilN
MSFIQINLLPEVKLKYIKSQRTRNLVVSGSVVASGIAVAILILMMATVYVVQKKQLSGADKDIQNASSQLESIDSLPDILTVQKQLDTLVGLHQSKHVTSRIFSYLPAVTPTNVFVGKLGVDLATNSMKIDGTAKNQAAVNTFIDTLKYTTYTIGTDAQERKAFTKVIESGFGITEDNTSYSLSVTFDPTLFNNNSIDSNGNQVAPKLHVPKTTTTRSVIDNPNSLFDGHTGTVKKVDSTGEGQ